VENPYFQYFCGEEFFQHALVFDRSSMTRWCQRMGEDKLKALLQETPSRPGHQGVGVSPSRAKARYPTRCDHRARTRALTRI
jgi:hypothetical protein